MSKIIVTAVLTTYKRPIKMVKRALESMIRQTYREMEIIVVNDYPEDTFLSKQIKDLVLKYEKSRAVYYYDTIKNSGACFARNLGLRYAKGKYIAFLDDDDEWLPEKIQKQVNCLEKNNYSLCYINWNIYEDGVKKRVKYNVDQPSGNILDILCKKNIIGSCSFPLIRTECIKNVGGFNEKLPALQDIDLYIRIMRNGTAFYIRDVLAVYHYHNGERISSNNKRRAIAVDFMLDEYKEWMDEKSVAYSNFLLKAAYFHTNSGQYKKALKECVLAINANPKNLKDCVHTLLRIPLCMIRGEKKY